MGKRAHCEVFRRHSDVPPFFQKTLPSPYHLPRPLQRRGVPNGQRTAQCIALLITSFTVMFAPATQTANAQSVTFGSIFKSF